MSFLSYNRKVNIKHFFAFFNYKIVFGRLAIAMSPFHVEIDNLKKGLKILGLYATHGICEDSREGMDSGEDARYNYEIALKK